MAATVRTRIVHIDMKGLPLTPEFLIARFAEMRFAGATGILLEWEDMLPFSGELSSLSCDHAFTTADVARVLAAATQLGLEIIPLVQTLGHCEYILKHECWAALREDAFDYGTLCPSSDEAAEMLRALLSQVIKLHGGVQRIHIGCDEPTLGAHALTAAAAAAHPDGLSGVLVSHVTRTAAMVASLGCRALMWHDAAVGMSDGCLERLLGTGAQLVVWDYRPSIAKSDASMAFLDRLMLIRMGREASDETMRLPLIATAYKGGDTPDAVLPRESDRLANQREWRKWWREQTSSSSAARDDAPAPIDGVVLTGWSRFGHLMPLTEMLPVAMPTLLRALGIWSPHHQAGADDDGGGDDVAATEALASKWRAAPHSGSMLFDVVRELEGVRVAVSALEEELRLHTPPATARHPPPRLLARVADELSGDGGHVARLTALGEKAVALLRDGVCRGDVDEWHAAKVQACIERARALLARAKAAHT